MAIIAAYRKDTGEIVQIPEHWIGHPQLGAPFSKTPRQKAADRAVTPPTEATQAVNPPASGDSSKGK